MGVLSLQQFGECGSGGVWRFLHGAFCNVGSVGGDAHEEWD
jgi:hypothetical protein